MIRWGTAMQMLLVKRREYGAAKGGFRSVYSSCALRVACLVMLLSAMRQTTCFAGSLLAPSAPTNVSVDGQPSVSTAVVSGPSAGELSGITVSSLADTISGVVQAPILPPVSGTGDIVAFAVQDANSQATAARYITFGQVFLDGAVQPGESLVAQEIGGQATPLQIDPLALWPDGSVRFAAVSLEVPTLKPAMNVPYVIASSSLASPTNSGSPLNFSASPFSLTVTLNFSGSSQSTKTINLYSALMQTLSTNPDFWLSGPLAVQARVDVPITNTLHVTADITEYKNGQINADVQFNNDNTSVINQPPGAPLVPLTYVASVDLDGITETYSIGDQYQYQDWHTVVSTGGGGFLNVIHDPVYFERTGALLPFDASTGVSAQTLNGMSAMLLTPGFGAPLATNGVTQYMPAPGGRDDIGYTTSSNATWLITQSPVAAAVALMQGDAGGAVPWNFKLASGRWLNTADYPEIWSDPRSGQWGTLALANSSPVPSGSVPYSGWTPDPAHMPDLAYIPYLMTASRWYLDRLDAQAAFSLSNEWPENRDVGGYADILMNTVGSQQMRAAAWSMRAVIEAAWIGKTGSWAQQYFASVEADNWNWAKSQESQLTSNAGVMAGYWLPSTSDYYLCTASLPGCSDYNSSNPPVWLGTAPWQQDFLSGVIIEAALMGDAQAQQIAEWQRNWIVGRFTGSGENPHDGCAYMIPLGTYPSGGQGSAGYFTSWGQMETALTASGLSNGAGWAHSNGYYCQLARSVLGGLLTLNPGDSGVETALSVLDSSGAPFIDLASLQNSPNFNVAPLQ